MVSGFGAVAALFAGWIRGDRALTAGEFPVWEGRSRHEGSQEQTAFPMVWSRPLLRSTLRTRARRVRTCYGSRCRPGRCLIEGTWSAGGGAFLATTWEVNRQILTLVHGATRVVPKLRVDAETASRNLDMTLPRFKHPTCIETRKQREREWKSCSELDRTLSTHTNVSLASAFSSEVVEGSTPISTEMKVMMTVSDKRTVWFGYGHTKSAFLACCLEVSRFRHVCGHLSAFLFIP